MLNYDTFPNGNGWDGLIEETEKRISQYREALAAERRSLQKFKKSRDAGEAFPGAPWRGELYTG